MDPNQFVMQLQQSGQIANLFADVRRGKALAINICKVTVADANGTSIDPKDFFGEEADLAEGAEGAEAADSSDEEKTDN
jgi:trigger factor